MKQLNIPRWKTGCFFTFLELHSIISLNKTCPFLLLLWFSSIRVLVPLPKKLRRHSVTTEDDCQTSRVFMADSNESDDKNSLQRFVSRHPTSRWSNPKAQASLHREIIRTIFFQTGFIQLQYFWFNVWFSFIFVVFMLLSII